MSFKLVSDVQQRLNTKLFGPGWRILGVAKLEMTNRTRERFFFLLMQESTGVTYIEEYDDSNQGYFVKIKEDKMWSDLFMWFTDKGLISMGVGKETKIAKRQS